MGLSEQWPLPARIECTGTKFEYADDVSSANKLRLNDVSSKRDRFIEPVNRLTSGNDSKEFIE